MNRSEKRRPCYSAFFLLGLLFFWLVLAFPVFATEKGRPAPDFVLDSLEGRTVRLFNLRGKFVLINFWATWCIPCKMEMPSLESLYRRFRSDKFELLAISNDMFGEKVVRPYVEANRYDFTVLIDSKLQASNLYGIVTLPTTFLIDPEGNVIGVKEGADDWDKPETLQFFEDLLKSHTTPKKIAESLSNIYAGETP